MLSLFLLRRNSPFRNLAQHLQHLFLDRADIGLDLFQGPRRRVAVEVPTPPAQDVACEELQRGFKSSRHLQLDRCPVPFSFAGLLSPYRERSGRL
jgi:hypothetical protein